MLQGFLLLIIFGAAIASIMKLWIEGSLFEGLHDRMFDFAYEEVGNENGEFKTAKRKGIIRGLVRGWLCAFCSTWQLSLIFPYVTGFNFFDYYSFYTAEVIENFITSALLALIAWTLYAFASKIREVEI